MSNETKQHFGAGDIAVFGGSLLVSIMVGLYFAFKDRKQKTVANYFFGGKQISPVSLGISLSVSYISAIGIIGVPSESYLFGMVCLWYAFASPISICVTCLYFIPLIHRLQLTTLYQYLEMRFHPGLRKLVSGCEVLALLLYMSFTLYAPSLALSAVSPINLYWSILLTSGVCTLYTTLGGMKAVVWTDVIQFGVMVVGVVAVLIKATIDVGGVDATFTALKRGGRTNFATFDPDPTLRTTFWTVMVGAGFTDVLNVCMNQPVCQRYLSCKSVKGARIAAVTALFPKIALDLIAVMSGCVAYAYFEGCDPLKAGMITKNDQMFPYLVLNVFREIPGMSGLFVAAAYCATMSTVSSGLNSVSGQILQDFLLPFRPNLSNKSKMIFSKLAVVFLGVLVTGFALLSAKLEGTVLSIVVSLRGGIGGAILGVYILGIFFPWCNTKGAITGQLVGTAYLLWIAIGGIMFEKSPESQRKLPVSTQLCNDTESHSMWNNYTTFNETVTKSTLETEKHYSPFYALSFWYNAIIGASITILVGLCISFLTGPNDPKTADPRLFCPIVDNHILPKKVRRFFRFGVPKIQKNTTSCEMSRLQQTKKSASLDSNKCTSLSPEVDRLQEAQITKQ